MGKRRLWIQSLVLVLLLVQVECSKEDPEDRENVIEYMSREERESLKNEARDMFYHAYNAYMKNAYPADELMPLSCKGRYRGSEMDRGDIDSTLGNFSLTLVDTLDTLVIIGDLEEFENAVKLVIKDVTFETDVIVSLFETNIRMLGGLLSGHILAKYLQLTADTMMWYNDELLVLAKDLGYRFLPAFNTTTGIPYGRINLKYGMKGVPSDMCRETCTACAGSMILEMAALSRLTGQSIFEEKAQKAMDALWKIRHRGTDLMGSVLNVHSGDWVRRDSGVGAGIDSYYEYCLKAYILLGDEKYLGRFNKHYQAIMKYVSQGPMLLDVHMHRPNTNSKNFMDALLAFWPGLQVLKGDIKPAVETHEMLYQVMQRHNFIPEAFTTDFQVHWGHHPLRPEFLESTYFLYRATGDHYYLGVGKKVLKSLQTYARVFCGYAAVSDVRTNKHDDTMDSFVLSETFKYLYLLFAEPSDLILDLDKFIFTTEGHLLPLTLAGLRVNVSTDLDIDAIHIDEMDRTCPNSLNLFPASVRQPLRNMVEDVCPRRYLKRRLSASQFQANNLDHLKILSNMGITVLTTTDGRMQLLHTFSNAKTVEDAEEGLMFMQEMIELNRKQLHESEIHRIAVTIHKPDGKLSLLGGPAQFGKQLKGDMKVTGEIVYAEPSEACQELTNADAIKGKIAIVSRGNCMFVEKAKIIEKAGAIAGVVLDTTIGSSIKTSSMFAMSGDGVTGDTIKIPMVFLFNLEANELVLAIMKSQGLVVTLSNHTGESVQLNSSDDELSIFEKLKTSLKEFLTKSTDLKNVKSNSLQETTQVDNEKVIEKGFLRARIVKDDSENEVSVEITINENQFESEKMERKKEKITNKSNFNTFHNKMKQQIIHQIGLSAKLKSPFSLSLLEIKRYYNYFKEGFKLVNSKGLSEYLSEKSTDEGVLSENLTQVELVSWFLSELINTKFFSNSDSILSVSKNMRNKLKSLAANYNDLSKTDDNSMKIINNMFDAYKVYDKMLDNIQKNLKNLKNEFHKHNDNNNNNYYISDDDNNDIQDDKKRTDEL